MTLFFETSRQAWCFLCLLPVGLAAAFLLDTDVIAGKLRPLADVFFLVVTGLAVLVMIVLCRDSGLRLYHMLGVLTGALLYLGGIGKIIHAIGCRQDLKRRAEK